MPSYAITCSSTCDLTPQLLADRDIPCVAFNYELGGVACKDDFGQTNSPAELYRKMLDGQECKTSQVAAGDYLELWKPLLEAGTDIVHVTLSSGISGTINSAITARDRALELYPDRTIHVIDSLGASSGYGLLMDRMADLRDEGMGADELAAWANAHRLDVQHWFFSTDLTFFVRGGRVSRAAGLVGGMLSICPVMNMPADGSLAVQEKIRTKAKAAKRVLQKMHETCQDGDDYAGKVFISQSECRADAERVAEMIRAEFPKVADIQIFNIGATIGVHTGPGTVATFWWGQSRAN